MIKTQAILAKRYENPGDVLNGSLSSTLFFKRTTVEQYRGLIASGFFAPDDRCELIHGWIIHHMPPNPPHSKSTKRLNRRIAALFPEPDWDLGIQDTIELSDSMPCPDVYVAHGPDDRYDDHPPRPADLVLVVEVSDSTLRFDSKTKLMMYAAEKIAQYWIVNVPDRIVTVHKRPVGGARPRFLDVREYRDGMDIEIKIDGKLHGRVQVRDILP
jgi:hypothetical protein